MDYIAKENLMNRLLQQYKTPSGFRSSFKAVPIILYDEFKCTIDFTKYYVMFRGPRPQPGFKGSTRRRYAHSFDVYMRSARDTNLIRAEREAFWRGVNWAKDNV